jgi:hypothetical protein
MELKSRVLALHHVVVGLIPRNIHSHTKKKKKSKEKTSITLSDLFQMPDRVFSTQD